MEFIMWGLLLIVFAFIVAVLSLLREEGGGKPITTLSRISKSWRLLLILSIIAMAVGLTKEISDGRQ
jgi:hypothetical protein